MQELGCAFADDVDAEEAVGERIVVQNVELVVHGRLGLTGAGPFERSWFLTPDTARRLARDGHTIVAVDRNADTARATADELGFSRISPNSMDAVGSRDALVDYLAFAAQLGVHPVEFVIDRLIESDGKELFNTWFFTRNVGALPNLLNAPHVYPGLADTGAHAGQICDADMSTHYLTYWQRTRKLTSLEDAVRRQLETLPHVMLGGLAHEQAYTLAQRLAALLPGDLDHVFFSDSGSVAVEVALKMALQYHYNLGDSRRIKFVAFRDGYHGAVLCGTTRTPRGSPRSSLGRFTFRTMPGLIPSSTARSTMSRACLAAPAKSNPPPTSSENAIEGMPMNAASTAAATVPE